MFGVAAAEGVRAGGADLPFGTIERYGIFAATQLHCFQADDPHVEVASQSAFMAKPPENGWDVTTIRQRVRVNGFVLENVGEPIFEKTTSPTDVGLALPGQSCLTRIPA